ncbi:MAG: hypothetical protein M3139_02695 [Bacteroidota bacterium]|nr:hypothetical protein [Bacteroidota bacterium]
MFDEILQLVKEHLGNNPQVSAAIPAGQEDAVHNEIATHVTNSLGSQTSGNSGMFGDIMSKLESGVAGGSPMTSAIEGGLVSSLASKFGLSPAITGAIAGALPGILQKYAMKKAAGNS